MTNKKKNNLLDDLEDSLLEELPKPKQYKGKKTNNTLEIKDVSDTKSSENTDKEPNLIESELTKFEAQINEVYLVLDSINPLSIQDVEERLKAIKLKMDIAFKLPALLTALEGLRNKEKLKANQIKGNKDISPLEDGTLD